MHSILLPNTQRVLFWGQTRPDQARLWDYSTPAGSFLSPNNQTADLTATLVTSDMWSAAHAILDTPEGLVLIQGGFSPNRCFTFNPDPAVLSYTQVQNTVDDRSTRDDGDRRRARIGVVWISVEVDRGVHTRRGLGAADRDGRRRCSITSITRGPTATRGLLFISWTTHAISVSIQ
jgi:hypothetical protein